MTSRCVYVVDDDRDVRCSLTFMLGTADIACRPFADGSDFLDGLDDLSPGCILLDVRMPGMDAFQVMADLERRDVTWPVIVMTGHGDVPVAVRAMKMGAVDFIEKPFSEDLLLASLERAFVLLEARREQSERKRLAADRIARLTAREREVLRALLAGLSNKMIADQLNLSLRTVEMHRGNMMSRLGVESLAEALTLSVHAGLPALVPADVDLPS